MSSLDAYVYERLKHPNNIRLLRLLPPKLENDIQLEGKLLEYSHTEADQLYTALSYACGDTSPIIRKAIVCDGRKLMVYPTLYSALIKLRDPHETRLVWCDGVCIDQGLTVESLQERSMQVQNMYEIYARAEKVVVDLGDILGTRHVDFLQAIHHIATIPTERFKKPLPFTYEYYDYEGENAAPKDGHDRDETESDSEDLVLTQSDTLNVAVLIKVVSNVICEPWLWSTFAQLLSRPYFTRLWVMQEHALAREVHFMLGNTVIAGQTMARGLLRLINIHTASSTTLNEIASAVSGLSLPNLNSAEKIFKTRFEVQSETGNSDWRRPEVLMYETFIMNCFDKRDKLYAILGICEPKYRMEMDLRVDYNEQIGSTCSRISKYLILNGAPFILYRSIRCPNVSDGLLPSWVLNLDMRKNDALSDLVYYDGSCGDNLFNAGMLSGSEVQPLPKTFSFCIENLEKLRVSAILLPVIESTSPTIRTSGEQSLETRVSTLFASLQGLSTWCSQQLPDNGDRLPSEISSNADIVLSTITVDVFQEMGRWHRANRYSDSPELASIRTAFQKWVGHVSGNQIDQENYSRFSQEAIPMACSLIFANGRKVAKSAPMTDGNVLLYLVPEDSLPGDIVAVLVGLPIPFVLRPVRTSNGAEISESFRIVGSAYVHGAMDGQAITGGYKRDSLVIV